jgi:leucine dehydrogenase
VTGSWGMPNLDQSDFDDHEGVHLFHDRETGLSAIIAVHSTHLGPAGGGTRFWHYANRQAAITDALRLSRGMSYKNAMAGLAMGGGKAVILRDGAAPNSPARIAAFAQMVESLNGRYVTAQDVGMSAADMVAIAQSTRHVCGLPVAQNMAGGDPGPATAYGVFLGIKAAVARKLGRSSTADVHIAIQGLGSVGGGVARHLAAEGARLTIADSDDAKAALMATELRATHVSASDIITTQADVFSPCALGAILNPATIEQLQVKIVAGGANNQLERPEDGDRLRDRDILYAPDYVINAGGIINVALEYLEQADRAAVDNKIAGIPARLNAIWDEADASGHNAAAVADAMARRLIGR